MSLLPCAILIPSLNRPQNLERLIEGIEASTPEAHTYHFAVSDDASMKILEQLGFSYLNDSQAPDRRYVTRMNKLVRYLTTEGSMFFGSDDVIHHPGWLSEALEVMDQGASVVVVNDLRNPNGTQAVMRREYLKRAVFDAPGDAFHHGYQHNFADNEQFFTAYKRNTYARALNSIVEHLHPLFQAPNSLPWDATYTNAQHGWDEDAKLFHERAQIIDATIWP